jgi:hypothetical protein
VVNFDASARNGIPEPVDLSKLKSLTGYESSSESHPLRQLCLIGIPLTAFNLLDRKLLTPLLTPCLSASLVSPVSVSRLKEFLSLSSFDLVELSIQPA